MQTFILDACALIAYIHREKGSAIVEGYLKDPTKRVVIHSVNFYEVYYDYLKRQPSTAFFLYELLKRAGIILHDELDKKTIEEGASLKIHYKMSLADSIALGFALTLDAPVLTADRHEFGDIAKAKLVKIKFIR